ncbi:MAG TPA: ABC transporter substrate-binding protein [Stellaceae bacterium]|jgi:phospholipid transport system substrate-binding protein|nr:ABC transporter substrate-binding protein [Stellaceae bacterium]
MTLSRRWLLAVLPAILAGRHAASAAEPGGAPTALIERYYGELLAVMKEAKRLTFDQRYARLAPAIARTFDLPLMTRIAIGPGWARLAPDQQQRLGEAFSRYTISNYANRFDDYNGERFEVDPNPAANQNGMLVKTGLIKSNGEKVVLNYLMRQDAAGSWKVIDVYLSGTVSELAARRSEFVTVLQRDGADGLVRMIDQRTAALRAG